MYCRSNMLIQNFMACSTDIKFKLFQSFCFNLYCAQLWYNSAVALCTAYNKAVCRLLLYKVDRFQLSASEMVVANNVNSLDVLIRKSLHGFYTCLVTCDNCIIKCLSDCFLFYASPFMKRYIDSVYNFS